MGLPEQVQFDNAREVTGWRPAVRYLSRALRLGLRYGIAPWLIPPARPQRNGGVENFKGRSQLRLFQRRLARPGDPRREPARREEAVNTQHVHPRLGGLTPAQHRRRQRLRRLPQRFRAPTERLPIAAGRVTFIRRLSVAGTVSVLSQSFRGGKRVGSANSPATAIAPAGPS